MALHMYLHSLFTCHCINLLHCKIQHLTGSYSFPTTSRKKEIIKLFVKERNLFFPLHSSAQQLWGGRKQPKQEGHKYLENMTSLSGDLFKLINLSDASLQCTHTQGWLLLESHPGSAALQTLKPPRVLLAVTPNCPGWDLSMAQPLLGTQHSSVTTQNQWEDPQALVIQCS